MLGTQRVQYMVGAYLAAMFDGRVFRGARENPTRLAAISVDVYCFQLVAYAISGALGGLACSPTIPSWSVPPTCRGRARASLSSDPARRHRPPARRILGAIVFLLIEEWLSGITEHWKMIFGPFLVLVVLFARGGLIGAWNEIAARVRKKARQGARHA